MALLLPKDSPPPHGKGKQSLRASYEYHGLVVSDLRTLPNVSLGGTSTHLVERVHSTCPGRRDSIFSPKLERTDRRRPARARRARVRLERLASHCPRVFHRSGPRSPSLRSPWGGWRSVPQRGSGSRNGGLSKLAKRARRLVSTPP
ncbi:hypothetical protein FRC12_024359 [Ceratobasidium sp. 428]|nr:hypothetical protein FRC12_024359 [Ceratobasidium sp. 428]